MPRLFRLAGVLCLIVMVGVAQRAWAQAGDSNSTCPVQAGEPVNRDIYAEYQGKRVYFCCTKCQAKFKENPESYIGALPQFAGAKSQTEPPRVTPEVSKMEAAPAAAGLRDRVGRMLGRMHPVVVHFPIALLLVAGLIELIAAVFGTERGRTAARACLCIGAAAAVVTAGMGWLNADFERAGAEPLTLALHRWGGIAIAAAAVIAAILSLATRGARSSLAGVARLGTLLVALMVVPVGHWGGTLVYGDGYVMAALTGGANKSVTAPTPVAATSPAKVAPAALPPAAETILYNSSDTVAFELRRAIHAAALPKPPSVPEPPGPTFNEIDRFIVSKWVAANLPEATKAPGVCDDATFCRRVYLDLIGVIPTIEESAQFATDARPDKRTRLIDELLARDADYADHWTPFWEDALGSTYTSLQGGVPTRGNYRQWINDSFKANKPFDIFAAELVDTQMPGAKKPEIVDANGRKSKVAYIRNETHTDTLQSAAAVAQVFLGTGMKCASCHSHFENDEWPQKRFLAYAGLFGGKDLEVIRCEKKSGETVTAAFCFDIPGEPTDVPGDEAGRLRRAAQMLTDPANPRFAKAIVNRLWKRYMGLGLFEPIDDFRLNVPPSHPELLEWLAADLIRHNYDLKRTVRLILTSRTYQLRYDTALEDHFDIAKKTEPRYYRSPSLRRLTAEQVVDSIRVAADQKLDPRLRLYLRSESTALSRALGKPASRNEISTARADDAAVVQALELLNGEEFSTLMYSSPILSTAASGGPASDAGIERLYAAVLGRKPIAKELSLAKEYLASAADRSTEPPAEPRDLVLLDDDTPAGASLSGEWKWVEAKDGPVFRGSRSHVQKAEMGKRIQHYAFAPFTSDRVRMNDTLYAYVYPDPKDPPAEIMLQWNDGNDMNGGGWSHRAFWGEDKIPFGEAGTPTRRRIGDLPKPGEWTRLEVPAGVVGFSGAGLKLAGMSFDQFGGTAHWDASGVIMRPDDGRAAAYGDLMWALVTGPEFQYIR